MAYRLHPMVRRLRRAGARVGQLFLAFLAFLQLLVFGLILLSYATGISSRFG